MNDVTDRFQYSNSDDDMNRLFAAVHAYGMKIMASHRAPLPLWRFSAMLAAEMGVRMSPELGMLSDGVKALLLKLEDPHLRFVSHSRSPGIGYIVDAVDRETWPDVH